MYSKRKDADLLPSDTNVEAGTAQPSQSVDLGGVEAAVVLSYAVSGSGSPSVTVEVQYAGNSAWVTLDGVSSGDADDEFFIERPVAQIRLNFEETGATSSITIDNANLTAHYND